MSSCVLKRRGFNLLLQRVQAKLRKGHGSTNALLSLFVYLYIHLLVHSTNIHYLLCDKH